MAMTLYAPTFEIIVTGRENLPAAGERYAVDICAVVRIEDGKTIETGWGMDGDEHGRLYEDGRDAIADWLNEQFPHMSVGTFYIYYKVTYKQYV